MSKSPAQRAAEYRARKKAAGFQPKSGRGKRKTKWDDGQFIALDGEGESVGDTLFFQVGKTGKSYETKAHHYTLLAASTGESIFNSNGRLDSQQCIDFLLDLSDSHKRAIFIIFAGSYDINHMLMYGFERDILQKISRGETYEYESQNQKYSIEYRARKSLVLRRGLYWKDNKKGKKVACWKSKITVWDVFGFFQESFVGVIGKWLGKTHKHYELIKRMKGLRGNFAQVPQSEINAYNAAELETLVELMDKVRDAITGLDLKCNRWDGAGAVAAAIMRKHHITEFKAPCDESVQEAIRCAYAGGRIEVCKIGVHHGPVYDYDVNSAYPSVMEKMPCMKCGYWSYQRDHIPSGENLLSLVHIKWDLPEGERFYPFFYRNDKMQICFPSKGEGWYWYPEFKAGYDKYGEYVTVLESYEYIQVCNHQPFHWIPEYYVTRQKWVKNPEFEWQTGGEKIIKLGLNSLYGKTAQQLGGKSDNPPAYHQLEWAGYITSATRARLYEAALCVPNSVIGFATDGIFTTRELPLELSRTKAMGAWELKEPVPIGMTIAMAGVYWWHLGGKEFSHFSRGFDKDSMKTPDKIIAAWKAGEEKISISMHRLIGMGSACSSDTLWQYRGCFTEGNRDLRLDGKSHKRQGINIAKTKPHKQLVDLQPASNLEYEMELQGCSHPYPLRWIKDLDDEYESDLEMQRENEDTENI